MLSCFYFYFIMGFKRIVLSSSRVAELEQENRRLLALTRLQNAVVSSSASLASSDNMLVSEVESLKAKLAAAEERERTLSAELVSKAVSSPAPVKVEDLSVESGAQLSPHPRPTVIPAAAAQGHKSSASLGLMVSFTSISIYSLISWLYPNPN